MFHNKSFKNQWMWASSAVSICVCVCVGGQKRHVLYFHVTSDTHMQVKPTTWIKKKKRERGETRDTHRLENDSRARQAAETKGYVRAECFLSARCVWTREREWEQQRVDSVRVAVFTGETKTESPAQAARNTAVCVKIAALSRCACACVRARACLFPRASANTNKQTNRKQERYLPIVVLSFSGYWRSFRFLSGKVATVR